jgi:acetate kinase
MRDIHHGLALDVYLHRLRAGIGAMAASLGGLDTRAFIGGYPSWSFRYRLKPAAHEGTSSVSATMLGR